MRKFTTALCTALALTTPSFGADTSALIRLTDREDLFGWEAVGRLNLGKSGYCTGTLIDNDLVLTAAHCVFDPKTKKPIDPSNVTFQAGLRDGKFIEESKATKIAVHKNYNPRAYINGDYVRHDVALIKLQKAITTFAASPFKLHTGIAAGKQVNVVSYGRGRDDALSWQRNCGITGRYTGLLEFNCNVTYGSSGAPVFVKEGFNFRILSLISVGHKQGKKTVSYGMELPKMVTLLKKDLTHNGAYTSGRKTTQARRLTVGGNKSTSGAKFIKN
ncbi:trypsin-like serine protease [Amylibacter sp. SFDW26]|uniref:trypsin-like serine peptidase n=1 Tax=Amylibacter sp. SFDW26 TaxID=2652722 RepID=UPI001261D7B9|nr:trypsin-like serine protease [Amylibacter sp. SFDW26]KAB7610407.1 trypsin-like serine protease [Amylibacter sp. SFDW26]